jgi:predicted dehydrogenase
VALRVGLVGAGPWAAMVHAPMLAAGPDTELAGVWARRPEAAAALAATHGVTALERYEDLLEACDAVAFAVPPSVQAEMGVTAARAGKTLLLEKPLADDLAGAERLAGAVAEAGVGSLVVLTGRFAAGVRAFLAEAADFGALGGRGCFLSGAFLGGPFATGWRLERGALLDVGPHAVDLLDAALGPVTEVRAVGDRHGYVALTLEHEGGAVSDVSLCCRVAIEPGRTETELYGPKGMLAVDVRAAIGPETFAQIPVALAAAAADPGAPNPLDAARGLHLQRIIAEAERQLA